MREAQVALSESQSKLLPLQLEVSKMTREKELLEHTLKMMEQQLASRTAELSKTHKESSARVVAAENEARVNLADKLSLQNSVSALQAQVSANELKIEALAKRARDMESEAASMLAAQSNEMKEKDKMVQLSKVHREEAHAKVAELETSLSNFKEASALQLEQQRIRMQTALNLPWRRIPWIKQGMTSAFKPWQTNYLMHRAR